MRRGAGENRADDNQWQFQAASARLDAAEKIGITVSLDGPGAINDALRPRWMDTVRFNVRRKLRALTEAGNGTSIRATITPMNMPYMNDIVELAAELASAKCQFWSGQ